MPSEPTSVTSLRTSGVPTERGELKNSLLATFRSPQYKPPVLPAVALELISLTRKSSASYEEVTHVVEKDPLLVADVLKLAQSPLYGSRQRVRSLQDALNRLGINKLRDAVWQVVIGVRVFRAPAYAAIMERLQSHSTFTAYAARVVAGAAGIPAENAFLCGLLHDVGWSGVMVTLTERNAATISEDALLPTIDAIHAEVGTAMGTLWGLSPEIIEVMGRHHDGQPAPALVPVICVSEQLADEFGFGIESAEDTGKPRMNVDENLVGRFEQAVASLRLEAKLERIRNELGEIAERMRANPQAGD
jgi:HD-like signal output (HDOD) protein